MSSININAIVDNYIDNLRDDAELSDNLPETVKIYKGVRRIETISDKFAIFVYRDSLGEQEIPLGKSIYHIEPTLHLVCVCRSPFNPEQLDEYQSHMASNVVNHIFSNIKQNGDNGWDYAIYTGSSSITVRNEDEQIYEIEIFPVRLGVSCITQRS